MNESAWTEPGQSTLFPQKEITGKIVWEHVTPGQGNSGTEAPFRGPGGETGK